MKIFIFITSIKNHLEKLVKYSDLFMLTRIGYVFGVSGLGPIENQELSDVMLSYWTNFAESEIPNSDELPVWEKMQDGEENWHVLGPQIGKQSIDRMDVYTLLSDFEFKGN